MAEVMNRGTRRLVATWWELHRVDPDDPTGRLVERFDASARAHSEAEGYRAMGYLFVRVVRVRRYSVASAEDIAQDINRMIQRGLADFARKIGSDT